MNECEIKEIVKAFAFGFSVEKVSEECCIPVAEAEKIRTEHAEEINEKAGECYE